MASAAVDHKDCVARRVGRVVPSGASGAEQYRVVLSGAYEKNRVVPSSAEWCRAGILLIIRWSEVRTLQGPLSSTQRFPRRPRARARAARGAPALDGIRSNELGIRPSCS